jgi:hypothetical protein
MCEILFIIYLARKIARMANEKGRSGFGYGCMFVGLWIGGEIAGFIAGAMLVHNELHKKNAGLAIYGCMVAGAAAGAVLSFIIVGSLSPIDIREQIKREYLGRHHNENEERRSGLHSRLDDAFPQRPAPDLDDRFR